MKHHIYRIFWTNANASDRGDYDGAPSFDIFFCKMWNNYETLYHTSKVVTLHVTLLGYSGQLRSNL